MGSESGDGIGHERRGGPFGFVGQDLGVDAPGMIVDGVVNEGVAPDLASLNAAALGQVPGPGIRFAFHPSLDPVTSSVRNAPELLYIDVDHLAGPGVLIPAGHGPGRAAVSPWLDP